MTRHRTNVLYAVLAILTVALTTTAHAYTVGDTFRARVRITTQQGLQAFGAVPEGMTVRWQFGSGLGVAELVGPTDGGTVWVRVLASGSAHIVAQMADSHGAMRASGAGITVTGVAPTAVPAVTPLPRLVDGFVILELPEPLPPELQ